MRYKVVCAKTYEVLPGEPGVTLLEQWEHRKVEIYLNAYEGSYIAGKMYWEYAPEGSHAKTMGRSREVFLSPIEEEPS